MAEKYLSKRANEIFSSEDFLEDRLTSSLKNLYHPTLNKEGIVNMGTALNYLIEEEWEEKLNKSGALHFSSNRHQHYFSSTEKNTNETLTEAVADFYNRHFEPDLVIKPSEISFASGTASCLNNLSFALFDEDDCFLTPAPCYPRTENDMTEKINCKLIPFYLDEKPNKDGLPFTLCPAALERRISQLLECGTPLKGFTLINPHNPIGDVYPPELLRKILNICAKYKLHVIVNEVYSFAVFDPKVKFTSVLSLKDLPDPDRIHHIWSISKDLGLAGIRCGFIHTRNSFVSEAIGKISLYSDIPKLIQDLCASILNDAQWLDNFFIQLNKKRLLEHYQFAFTKLSELSVYVRPVTAGLFLWFDLRPFLSENTKEAEIDLFWEFSNAGVILSPGSFYFCPTPGWFRLVFSIPKDNLQTGLTRIASVLEKKRKSN